MSMQVYSCAVDGARRLSANFAVREFACADGSDPVFIDSELVDVLQSIRDHFGRAVTINSGYRTVSHNRSVGGAACSMHCYGRAADVRVRGVAPADVAAYAETLLPDCGGIGTYPTGAKRPRGWVHIDVRKPKARWQG